MKTTVYQAPENKTASNISFKLKGSARFIHA